MGRSGACVGYLRDSLTSVMEHVAALEDMGNLGRTIPLATRLGRKIPNKQDLDLPPNRAAAFVSKYRRDYRNAVLRRSPTGQYNCHGLTFASRRTQVLDVRFVRLILKDDGYGKVPSLQVREGDVVVYWQSGEITHTGVVVQVEENDMLIGNRAFRAISKWGSGAEYIHFVPQCPYAEPGAKITYWSDVP